MPWYTSKKKLRFIYFIVVVSLLTLFILLVTGNRPPCIKGNLGRERLPHGWYRKSHPWKKDLYCRYSGKGTDNELEEDGNFFCYHDGRPYIRASNLGINPDDPHDEERSKVCIE